MSIEINKEFLESVVKEPIVSFTIKPGSSSGDNVAGDLIAIEVTTETNQEIHLVQKTLPPPDSPGGQFAAANKIYRTEAQIYWTVIPKLEQLVNARLDSISKLTADPTTSETPHLQKYEFPVPKFYAAFNNDVNDHITLGDLRPEGYKMPDKFAGLEYEEVSLILKELAAFHAYSYFLIKYCGEQLFNEGGEFGYLRRNLWLSPERGQFAKSMLNYMYVYTTNLVKNESQRKSLQNKISPASCYDKMVETMLKTDRKLFPVLVHGDLWINNVLLKYSEQDRKPSHVKFIDFQLARRGNIYEDLLYFVFTSTTPKFRKLHLNQVLHEYFDSFESSLRSIQFPMPAKFTRGSFIDGFYEGIFPIYIYLTFAIPMQFGDFAKAEEMKNNSNLITEQEVNIDTGDTEGPAKDMIITLVNLYSTSPKAVQRFIDITDELFELNIV